MYFHACSHEQDTSDSEFEQPPFAHLSSDVVNTGMCVPFVVTNCSAPASNAVRSAILGGIVEHLIGNQLANFPANSMKLYLVLWNIVL